MKSKRTVSISFRVSVEEKNMITNAAKAFKKSVSAFVRDIILGISGDIVNIFGQKVVEIAPNPSLPQNLNPPKRILPKIEMKMKSGPRRGSANDYRNCMRELKQVLRERCIAIES